MKQLKPFPYYYERLPTFKEVYDACYERDSIAISDLFDSKDPEVVSTGLGEMWFTVCLENNIFQLWNKEYIESLAEEIKSLVGEDPCLEVAAGDGMLSHWLRQRGVNIKATDDMSRTGESAIKLRSEVEKLDAIEAIQKYRPRLVVVSWVEYTSTLDTQILDERPEYVIIIGEGHGGCTGSEDLWENYSEKGYSLEYLSKVDQFNICRTDSAILGFSLRRHSCTALFRLVT